MKRLMGASLLVFLNKMDVEGCMTISEIQEVSLSSSQCLKNPLESIMTPAKQELRLSTIRTHNWTVIECSAITGANLQEGLSWVVEDAKQRLFLY